MSLRPFFSLEPRTEKSKIESSIQLNSPRISSKDEIDDLFYLGRHFRVQWRLVIWVTLRDQVNHGFFKFLSRALHISDPDLGIL